jgi:anti-anti-sigma factor
LDRTVTDERSIKVAGLAIHCERTDDLAVITLSGDLSLANADAFQQQLQRIEAAGVAEIVVDLRNLDFIDSTGVRTMYSASIRLREGDRLRIIPGPAQVQRAFATSGVARVFPFID